MEAQLAVMPRIRIDVLWHRHTNNASGQCFELRKFHLYKFYIHYQFSVVLENGIIVARGVKL
jgi:hypothetical protein